MVKEINIAFQQQKNTKWSDQEYGQIIFYNSTVMMKDIILFGMQGSGKGTQAAYILELLPDYTYLEMWNIFRTLTKQDNIIGNYVKDSMKAGYYVHDTVTAALFAAAVYTSIDKPLLIDGFPRKIGQMYTGMDLLTKLGRDYIAFNFTLPEEVAINRLMKRAEEQGREDDTPDAIKKRIQQFYSETKPVLDHFKSIDKLITINADQSPELIFSEIKKHLVI